ncbi:hypothetical protein BU26DRAFT_570882 [Trematosphaeria pertusa]|uniref:Uncharacterized protein n=1 Tax=Trematosphaeria pertusa TaxID=390896 RepID=A0A6A6HWT2_9PLEO|nr:uncharacterized protein BU26DRAFT_570882 [Trematosphaeria pertusa]KAF2242192.1 hypothetical protein BU26DRAFT_570882 [Trematosphaeria pertusa]
MLEFTRRLLRNLLLGTLFLIVLVHGPFFRIFINLLITMHVILRIAADHLQRYLGPIFIDEIRGHFAPFSAQIMAAIRPALHDALAWMTHQATTFIHKNPWYLCQTNEGIVAVGEGLVRSVLGDEGEDLAMVWQQAGKGVATFCKIVRGGMPA